MRLYAAGVRSISTEGCFLLCGRWDSLAHMLRFFPNVRRIGFETIGASYHRSVARANQDQPLDELRLDEEVRTENGHFRPPKAHPLPNDLSYDCLYQLDLDLAGILTTATFSRNAEGDLILPDVLCLPAWRFMIHGTAGSGDTWTQILRQRKAQNIVTHAILLRIQSFSDLDLLSSAAGFCLTGLEVQCSAEDFEDVDQTLTSIMNHIDAARFPILQALTLRIDFPSDHAPERPPQFPSDWLSYDMPPRLSSVYLDLVLDTWSLDLSDDMSDDSIPMGIVEHTFEEMAPRQFIVDVRTKLGELFTLIVENQYQIGSEIFDYHRPMTSFVDYLLYESLSVIDGSSSSGRAGSSSEDNYDPDLDSELGSDSGNDGSRRDSLGDSEDDEPCDEYGDNITVTSTSMSRSITTLTMTSRLREVGSRTRTGTIWMKKMKTKTWLQRTKPRETDSNTGILMVKM